MKRKDLSRLISDKDFIGASNVLNHYEDTSGCWGWFRAKKNNHKDWSETKQVAVAALLRMIDELDSEATGGTQAGQSCSANIQQATELLRQLIIYEGISITPYYNIIQVLSDAPNRVNGLNKLKHLLAAGMDIQWQDSDGFTLAHYAASNGNIEWLDFLQSHLSTLEKMATYLNTTVLMSAIMDEQSEFVEDYLSRFNQDQQASMIHQTDQLGVSPLMHAALNGDLVLIDILIKAGADINDKVNLTIKEHSLVRKDLKLYFFDNLYKMNPYRIESYIKHLEDRMCSAVLFDQWTPLMIAARYGSAEQLSFFLSEYQPDPFTRNSFGRTPLLAIPHNKYDTATKEEILIQYQSSYQRKETQTDGIEVSSQLSASVTPLFEHASIETVSASAKEHTPRADLPANASRLSRCTGTWV